MYNQSHFNPSCESELDSSISEISGSESRMKAVLGEVAWKARALFRLIKAYSSGAYRDVPWKTIASATGALVYFVSPIDAIPDIIPGIGFADDAIVIATVVSACAYDISQFLQWERLASRLKTVSK